MQDQILAQKILADNLGKPISLNNSKYEQHRRQNSQQAPIIRTSGIRISGVAGTSADEQLVFKKISDLSMSSSHNQFKSTKRMSPNMTPMRSILNKSKLSSVNDNEVSDSTTPKTTTKYRDKNKRPNSNPSINKQIRSVKSKSKSKSPKKS